MDSKQKHKPLCLDSGWDGPLIITLDFNISIGISAIDILPCERE